MQHLVSEYGEEDVADEVPYEDVLHGDAEGADVGSLAKSILCMRLPVCLIVIIPRFEAFSNVPAVFARRYADAQIHH